MLANSESGSGIVAFADPSLLLERAEALGVTLRIRETQTLEKPQPSIAGVLDVFPIQLAKRCTPGRLDASNAPYVLQCLDRATEACRAGHCAALVTGPVQKSVINELGLPFTGHTEYLAQLLDAPLPVMMLVSGSLRVALVTTHAPLREVPDLITRALLRKIFNIVAESLRHTFRIRHPKVGVCGLNPHAGEHGHLGAEELEVIAPAIETFNAEKGTHLVGPLPADTLFTQSHRAQFDAIIAMYHDQGLAALKAVSFGEAVNITLGLPIIRTSVDHGTALSLAGRGGADVGSLAAATQLARTLSRQRE